MKQNQLQTNGEEIIEEAYNQLEIEPGASTEDIIEAFRSLALNHCFASTNQPHTFQTIATAYRFLSNIPICLCAGRKYEPTDILATLIPIDKMPERIGSIGATHLKACAMMDVAVHTMERAQQPYQLPYTNYVITVHYCMRQHVVRRRYSEFVKLHQALTKHTPIVPQLPSKSWYTRFSMSACYARDLALYLSRVIALLASRGVFSLDIMAFLDIDFVKIRADEEALAIKLLNNSSTSYGRTNYCISSDWLEKWRYFVAGTGPPPGEIDNSNLLTGKSPKQDLELVRDYRIVNGRVWRYFIAVYHGGPEIARNTNSIYGPPAFDRLASVVCFQRLCRGFLARVEARKRRAKLKMLNPAEQRRVEILQEQDMRCIIIEKIRTIVSTQEETILDNAARTLQRAFRRYMDKPEEKPQQQQPGTTKKEAKVASKSKISQWQPRDTLSLDRISKIEIPQHRFAQFLHTMKIGITIQKVGARFKSDRNITLKINEDGSKLIWTSRKKQDRSIILGRVSSIETSTGDISASPRKKKFPFSKSKVTDPESMLAITESDYTLLLACSSREERIVLKEQLDYLVEENAKRLDAAGYVDSYGNFRRKSPHARKLLREAEKTLHQDPRPEL